MGLVVRHDDGCGCMGMPAPARVDPGGGVALGDHHRDHHDDHDHSHTHTHKHTHSSHSHYSQNQQKQKQNQNQNQNQNQKKQRQEVSEAQVAGDMLLNLLKSDPVLLTSGFLLLVASKATR